MTATAARVRAKVSEAELKAVRGRLQTGSSIEPAFEYELLSIFARNEIRAAVTMPALSLIFSLASMFWAPKYHALAWLLLVIMTKVWLLWQCGKFLADADGPSRIALWRRRFIWAELLTGVSWAGFVLVGIDPQIFINIANNITAPAALHEAYALTPLEFSANVFVFATLIVVLAIRMTFAATVIPILYAGTIPMTLAVVARMAIYGDPFCLALAAMAVGVHLYFIWLARGLNSTAIDRLKFRAQKDLLISALEEEKAISEEARRRAEEANKAKSRFLATMSHELRTPLNAIMGFSEVMEAEILGPMANPTYKDYAGNIHDSGRHLLNLINEILDLSRIEAGRYELTEERLHLADVADDCHRLLKLRAQAKGLQIIENIPANLPPVWADQRALRQICLNLMSNALKFTPKGGSITITIALNEAGEQILSVRDTGPGIPADEIPKVLQAFGQGSLAHQTAEGGTGLGLSIVQNLIELHGGTFELKSELRKGTEATITLPRGRVLAASPPLQPLGNERHKFHQQGPALTASQPSHSSSQRAPRLVRPNIRPITARARA